MEITQEVFDMFAKELLAESFDNWYTEQDLLKVALKFNLKFTGTIFSTDDE